MHVSSRFFFLTRNNDDLTGRVRICKDNSKKFCPSCGNPTLLRASVTLASPTASPDAPVMTVHLKKDFQYRLRGTVYSIPSPKPGSAKGGPGEGLVLREDQAEWIRATRKAKTNREKEEKKIMKEMTKKGGLERGVATGSWMDPDWLPGMLSSASIKNESKNDGMPVIGYGKRNPNERRRNKK
jgi:RNA-binding protein NOB1